jgi:hypothetical protein
MTDVERYGRAAYERWTLELTSKPAWEKLPLVVRTRWIAVAETVIYEALAGEKK